MQLQYSLHMSCYSQWMTDSKITDQKGRLFFRLIAQLPFAGHVKLTQLCDCKKLTLTQANWFFMSFQALIDSKSWNILLIANLIQSTKKTENWGFIVHWIIIMFTYPSSEYFIFKTHIANWYSKSVTNLRKFIFCPTFGWDMRKRKSCSHTSIIRLSARSFLMTWTRERRAQKIRIFLLVSSSHPWLCKPH